MQLLAGLALALVAPSATANVIRAAATYPASPEAGAPCLKPAFAANVTLGPIAGAIAVPAGEREVEPLAHGTIVGPAINGTLTGGVAYPIIEDNGTVQDVSLAFYGMTTDGTPFFVQGSGIGNLTNQFARLQFDVTGPYHNLSTSFVLGEIHRLSSTNVAVRGYVIQETC